MMNMRNSLILPQWMPPRLDTQYGAIKAQTPLEQTALKGIGPIPLPDDNKTLSLKQKNVPPIPPSICLGMKRAREEEASAQAAKKQKIEQRAKQTPRLTSSTISRKYFELIREGKKTVEGRINKGMFARLKVGEQLQFFIGKDKLRCNVTKLHSYASFKTLLEKEGVASCLPDIKSLEAAVQIYNKIPGYAKKEAEYGVIAIHLEIVPLPPLV